MPFLCRVRSRSIPAGAGEPSAWYSRSGEKRVYPRGCGGAALSPVSRWRKWGLSPRVRGSQRRSVMPSLLSRSIPAGAGEPTIASSARNTTRVYPRGCGGATKAVAKRLKHLGLSPRVRGSLALDSKHPKRLRSIPAGAGEPQASNTSLAASAVYPRGCGGAN